MVSPRNTATLKLERWPVSPSCWPDLPSELLERIIVALGPRDPVAIRLVCASWLRYVQKSFPSPDLPFEVPRLLIRQPAPHGDLAFFSLHPRKILPFSLPARLNAWRCCGQTPGWLAMARYDLRAVVLYNPTPGRIIALPPPPVFPVKKIVLSAPPTTTGWVPAVLGRTGTIVLHQPAISHAWMTIGIHEGNQHNGFRDMVFWLGRLCALGHDGVVLSFCTDFSNRATAMSDLREPDGANDSLMYLVESDGKLLWVQMQKYPKMQRHVQVQILASAGLRKWDNVNKTAGKALFVGSVVLVVVLVALYAVSGLRESCIYCAWREVEMEAPHAIFEYSLLDHKVTGVSIAAGHCANVKPVWITLFV
ncbi:unnamed protein product [Urochloa decumbens]|uniref:KIB1-4 beta-propeller domain-containing protein n=1 Tax=Urochloa decumbens TaxID=240449 RepID=A0ABC8YWJ0_9POAL